MYNDSRLKWSNSCIHSTEQLRLSEKVHRPSTRTNRSRPYGLTRDTFSVVFLVRFIVVVVVVVVVQLLEADRLNALCLRAGNSVQLFFKLLFAELLLFLFLLTYV